MNITGVNSNSQFFSVDNGVRAKDYTYQPGDISASGKIPVSGNGLDEKQQKEVEELKKIDEHVKQHESAHQAAAGELFRGKSFSYKIGPDGKRYAVAGEVQIDTSPIKGNPAATKAKMEKVKRAATAPSDPSPQDYKVAEAAAKAEAAAADEESKESPDTNTSAPDQKSSPGKTSTGSKGKTKPGTLKASVSGLHISHLYAQQLKTDETRRINVYY